MEVLLQRKKLSLSNYDLENSESFFFSEESH